MEISGLGFSQGLVRLAFTTAKLQYAVHEFFGAVEHPYLAREAADALAQVRADLVAQDFDLLVWDAYRTRRTQQHIFDLYFTQLRQQYPHESETEIHARTLEFVSDPKGLFPHGTGGAVDVTLLRNGIELDLGTAFDDFSPRSAALHFEENPPIDESDKEIARLRGVLCAAMLRAGFVGLDSEWWHYEIYTHRWAMETGHEALLTTILDDPTVVLQSSQMVARASDWPQLQLGVAELYTSARERRSALNKSSGNYYARKSTRTSAHATAVVARVFHSESAHLVQSGLAAFACAFRALLPRNGVALVDWELYYESKAALLEYAWLAGIDVITANLSDTASIDHALSSVSRLDLVVVDSPSNWFLTCQNVARLRELADRHGAKLLIDISVQPLQPETVALADLAIVSLSKWPTAGHTLGGAVLGPKKYVELAERAAAVDGHVLSAEAALTLLQQLPSLPDRIANVSRKARQIRGQLLDHPEVAIIRLAEDGYFRSECGGQLVIELVDAKLGCVIEQIVGFNAYSAVLTLPQLACTFGASVSTIEHFASNTRHREGLATDRSATGEALIPGNFLRISVGNCTATDLAAGLALVLRLARDCHPYEPHRSLHS